MWNPCRLMRPEQGLGQAARLEQREAQQHRISHAGPDGGGHIASHTDVLHQHGVDAHAHHNEKRLEAQGKQGTQIVLSRMSPIPVGHGGKRNWSNRGGQ